MIRTLLCREPARIIGGLLTHRSGWVSTNIKDNIEKNLLNCNSIQELDFICCLSEYACEIRYTRSTGEFHGTKIDILTDIDIINNKTNSPLIYTYFKLLRMLQDMGNCPAIDYQKYGIDY